MAEVGESFCCNCLFLVAHKLSQYSFILTTHAWCQPKGRLSESLSNVLSIMLRLGEREKKELLQHQISNFGAGVELATGILRGPSSLAPH